MAHGQNANHHGFGRETTGRRGKCGWKTRGRDTKRLASKRERTEEKRMLREEKESR